MTAPNPLWEADPPVDIKSPFGAIFSADELFRFLLWRDLGRGEGTLVACCLNPSTATATKNDPTITRFIERGRRMGFRRFEMVNLFAYRSTNPRWLVVQQRAGVDVSGGKINDDYILAAGRRSTMFVCGWGDRSPLVPARARHVVGILLDAGIKLHAIDIGKAGQPMHPLYLPYESEPQPWRATDSEFTKPRSGIGQLD